MEHGERIAEVNSLLTSGEKMSQKKISALAGVDLKKNRHGGTGVIHLAWTGAMMRFADIGPNEEDYYA